MANLPWIRLDTNIFQHPKMLYLAEAGEWRAIVLHLKAMTYSAQHDLNGYIPDISLVMLARCSGTCSDDGESCSGQCLRDAQHDAKVLLNVCVWAAQLGGINLHDWEEYQAASEEAKKRSDKARLAAQARWAKRNGNHSKPPGDRL